jgi:TrmH family RNA methyltransferase
VSELSKNKIKWIRSLQQKKYRDDLGLFIVEGEKLVHEAILYTPELIELIAYKSDFKYSLLDSSIEQIEVNSRELEQISSLQSPNKALAILKKPVFNLSTKSDQLILALDSVQDPGNMGTIMRIADWFGVNTIVCSETTVDCFNPKVVQSSMGAIFRIQTHYTNLEDWLINCDSNIYGALLEGEDIYQKTDLPNGVLLMGNEGKGISNSLQKFITHPISIPRFGHAESLNVSVATGIIVSEFLRRNIKTI